jgi:hypothetical protein
LGAQKVKNGGRDSAGLQTTFDGQTAITKNEHKDLISKYPDSAASIKQLFKVLCDIENLASHTPLSGQSEEWAAITSSADENRENYCEIFQGKTLFRALYGTYTVTLNGFKSVLKASEQGDGFKEVCCRKRRSSEEAART